MSPGFPAAVAGSRGFSLSGTVSEGAGISCGGERTIRSYGNGVKGDLAGAFEHFAGVGQGRLGGVA